MKKSDQSKPRESVQAVALFSVLMHAREHEELQDAAQAQRELERMGVMVKFKRQRQAVTV